MENSDNIENSDNTENKKEVVIAPDKEESVSLKDNKEIIKEGGKKKKSKKISLQNLNLHTKPINISSSNDFIYFTYLTYLTYFIRSRIRIITTIIVAIIVLIILLTLKGIFHSPSEEEKNEIVVEKKDVVVPENKVPQPSPSPSPEQGEKINKKKKKKKHKSIDN